MRCPPLVPLVSLALVLSVTCTTANPGSALSPWSLHEQRTHLPAGWSRARKHHPSAPIPLRFALTQSNLANLEQHLYDVSHPHSPNYGKHWSPAQITNTFAPADESADAVVEWLLQSGVDRERVKLSPTKGWIHVSSTVEEAEALLHTEYHVYGHESGKEHVACNSYHLPAHITSHIDFVTPTIHFDAKLEKRSTHTPAIAKRSSDAAINPATDISNCDEKITPACIRALYNFYYEPVAADRNSFGIVEYNPQAYIQSDLDSFARNFSTGLEDRAPNMISIDGGFDQHQANLTGLDYNGESNLDLEYAMTLATSKQNVTLFQVGELYDPSSSPYISFNNFLDALDGSYCTYDGGDDSSNDVATSQGKDCGTTEPTNVFSTSYYFTEVELSVKYVMRQCHEYGKLGLMGVSVLYCSGDNGVGGSDWNCTNPDGVLNSTGKIFSPSFPSTCPYVTSVGATQIMPGNTVNDPESACENQIYSGGGWSNYFAMPDYQRDAVSAYLKDYPPAYPADIWNSTGVSRAFPDLSANGANYVIASNGVFQLVSGTSASSPVVAAMLTMINDARIAVGKSPVGFINPAIYSLNFTSAFHDITNGTNPGCGTKGFNATRGWDPVTGLGTPDFPALLDAWMQV
ncbi:peptidase S8/S53 domain-containing protein [Hygrophoropsis aurantiaca]|uniref:Peptidase S8/S53 domain-containing protein n=1 Tax=Hygrophoropsis aurantiaca TaxID=72124 RepID=A0ACB8A429_9AGAM|nr:peptidase S8/S53 domain-containing protein [Hygrophoropsis aurantiaca]